MHPRVKPLLRSVAGAWGRVKYPIGYALFAATLTYGLRNAPPELWALDLSWLMLSFGVILIMFALQHAQVSIFLRAHGVRPGWLYPALFNARRGILNTLLPARSGTFLLLRGLTERYAIQWHHFLLFFLLAGMIAVYVSAIALVWVLWPWPYSAVLVVGSGALGILLARRSRFPYAVALPKLLLLAGGLYLANTALLYCVLRGLGFGVSAADVAYLAVVLNILAQVSVTPGNLGVREIAMGAIAPQVGLPIAVGILGSSLMVILRLVLYGALWGALEWMDHMQHRSSRQAPP